MFNKGLKRTFALILMLILAVGLMISPALNPIMTVRADGNNCYGLSADDCTLVKGAESQFALEKIASSNTDYELTLNIQLPSGKGSDISVKGSGPVQYDFAGVSGMSLARPARLLDKLIVQLTAFGSTTLGDTTIDGFAEMRILNGTLYLKGDKLTGGQWKSIDLATQLADRLARSSKNTNLIEELQALNATGKVLNIRNLVKAERATDLTIEDQKIAVFVYHVDLSKLFGSTDFEPILRLALEQVVNGKVSNERVKFTAKKLSDALKDSTFSITELVGTLDKLPHGLGSDLTLKIDPQTLTAIDTTTTTEPTAPPFTANIHFLVKLSGFGTKPIAIAPTGVTPFSSSGILMAGPTPTASGG